MSLFDQFLKNTAGQTTLNSKDLWRDDFSFSGPKVVTSQLLNFPNLPAVKKHMVISSELSRELEYLQQWDVCQHCRANYRRLDNLGTHRCRYHPDPTTNAYVFGCCGIDKENPGRYRKGCTPCDHSPPNLMRKPLAPRWTKATVFTRVPRAARHLLQFPDSSIVGEETNPHDPIKSYIIVTRVYGFTLHDI